VSCCVQKSDRGFDKRTLRYQMHSHIPPKREVRRLCEENERSTLGNKHFHYSTFTSQIRFDELTSSRLFVLFLSPNPNGTLLEELPSCSTNKVPALILSALQSPGLPSLVEVSSVAEFSRVPQPSGRLLLLILRNKGAKVERRNQRK